MNMRTEEVHARYLEYLKGPIPENPFEDEQVLQTFGEGILIENRFPYSEFDGKKVLDHKVLWAKTDEQLFDALKLAHDELDFHRIVVNGAIYRSIPHIPHAHFFLLNI